MIYTTILRHMIEDNYINQEAMLSMLDAIDTEHQKALDKIERMKKGDEE